MIRLHFRRVIINGDFDDRDLPVLLIGNHFSWWDGFIANFLNNMIFHRKFHIMMLEEQLSGRMFLNKAGAFSIKKGSRSVIESLHYTRDLLKGKENLVVLYPQGEFESIYRTTVRFEKGMSTIVTGLKNKLHVVFYAALVDYFSHRKPALTIYLREIPQEMASNPEKMETAYNTFLTECVMQQKPD